GSGTIRCSAATQIATARRIVAPFDFIWNNQMPLDFDGHGTHVAGRIGQLTNDNIGTAGVAFNVKLMPVKVIDSVWDDIFGAPNVGTDETVARGIRYAADNGAKVINMSIGRTGPPNTAPVVEDAMRYAVRDRQGRVHRDFRRKRVRGRESAGDPRRDRLPRPGRRLGGCHRSERDVRRSSLQGHAIVAELSRVLLDVGQLRRARRAGR